MAATCPRPPKNLAEPWGRSDGQMDPERVALLAQEEAGAPQALQEGAGRGPPASGPPVWAPEALPGQAELGWLRGWQGGRRWWWRCGSSCCGRLG